MGGGVPGVELRDVRRPSGQRREGESQRQDGVEPATAAQLVLDRTWSTYD
jgi:hypothetical protein